MMVMKPVTTQAAISRAGEFDSRAMSAETMKMPEPIMDPMTSVVALVRPSPLTNSWSWVAGSSWAAVTGCVSVLKVSPVVSCAF